MSILPVRFERAIPASAAQLTPDLSRLVMIVFGRPLPAAQA
jgi:hypothetical protein